MIIRSATGAIDPGEIANRQEFAAALTALREDAGLTVRQVARAAGINPSTAGGYFSGRHLPPLRPQGSVRSILAACGVTDQNLVAAWERSLAKVRRPPGPRPGAVPSPYRGLARYSVHDGDWFFGRDEDIRLLHRQSDQARRQGGIVVLLGAAGSGKSSLLAAGLSSRLQHGLVVHPVATLTPGADPLRALATALATLINGDPVVVLDQLRQTPTAARDLARRAIAPTSDRVIVLPRDDQQAVGPADGARVNHSSVPSDNPQRPSPWRDTDLARRFGHRDVPDPLAMVDPYPVIVVDQLEELFVRCSDAVAQHAFLAALTALARPGRDGAPAVAVVVAALRTEFLTQAARYPDLRGALHGDRGGTVTSLRAMTPAQLRSVIIDPARRAGLDLDEGLVDCVLADLATTPEPVLPRVSHALLVTWSKGQRSRLTVPDYQESGGTHSSLATTAEMTFLSLSDAARAAAPAVFRRAAGLAPLSDPDVAVSTAVEQVYIEAGLLTVDRHGLRLMSDVLIPCWPRLQEWLPEGRPPGSPPAQREKDRATPTAQPLAGQQDEQTDPVRDNDPGQAAARMARWWAWRWAFVAAVLLGGVLTGVWALH